MDIVTFTAVALVCFMGIVKYMEHKQAEALAQRWELVNFIAETECNDELKSTIASMYTDSMDRFLLPKLLWYTIIIASSKELKQKLISFDHDVVPTKEEKEIFNNAFKKMLKVNFSYVPHWYVLFGIIALLVLGVMEFFIRTGKTLDRLYNYQQKSYLQSVVR